MPAVPKHRPPQPGIAQQTGELQRLLAGQNEILRLIAAGRPSAEVLERVTRTVEAMAAPAICSILVVEDGCLRHAAKPRLPESYVRAVDGMAIGPKVGSCGTAAYRRAPVVVRDIATDPLWEDYRDFVLPLGLRACWSQPILADDGEVLGTFALYYDEPREPAPQDWELLQSMAQIVRVLIDRDERERALLEARNEAAAANRMKSEFLANMSHELRTPLNAIIGFSEIMVGELLGPLGTAAYRDYVHDIRESGAHLLQIITQVLDLSRIEAGRFELSDSVIDLHEVFAGCRRIFAERTRSAGIELESRVEEPLPLLRADEVKIKQALLNLLSNAVKFTSRGGKVEMAARPCDDGGIGIEISDSGIGMRPDDIPIALEPFRQVENSFSRKYQGTGLGLPLAKSIVELHGGRLSIRSQPGRGTTVVVWVPAERTVARASAEPFA